MKYALVALVLCGFGLAQVKKTRLVRSDKDQLIDLLKSDLDRERPRTADMEKRLADSEHAKIEAQAKLAAAETVLQQMHDAGIQVIAYTHALEGEYKKAVDSYNSLSDKYNQTVMQANNIIETQNQHLARQQRIANALAVYSAMPRYTPIQPPPPPNKTFTCISNTMGTSTYTNCN